MCGICGIIGETKDKEKVLARMMKVMEHRGPDGGDTYASDGALLGFRRLSIIDLDTGMQPMVNEDGSMALVFNGEIYNYQTLRKVLKQKGHEFRNSSDSEVILHGYEEYQKELLGKLRGMFGFAVWDDKKKSLFAARDYFGIKPFYYAVVENTLVFASEIKCILEYPGYQKKVNEEALEQYLSFQYSALPETFFKGIYKLLPGHYLTFENQELKVGRYFEPTLDPGAKESESAMIAETRKVMNQSVKRHLISDVEVGSFLSSGVDSSLIAALSKCNRTFTVGFAHEGDKYNEITYAKELSKKIGIENQCKYISREEFKEAIPKVMYHMDEPLADASAVALYFLAQEASKKVKVVLSGEGADEIFGGYNIYLEPKALGWSRWIPLKVREKLASAAERLPRHMKGRNYLIRAARPLSERYIGNAYIFTADERKRLLRRKKEGPKPNELLKKEYDKMRGLPDSDQMQALDLVYWLPGDILLKADKMSMAHSLEVRVPFLDKDVFEVARRIPHSLKTKKYTTKYVLRKVADEYLPEQVAKKKKLGFPIPIRNWFKEEDWYQQIKTAFTGETAAKYFCTKRLVRLLEEHRSGREDNSRKIWTVYAFLVWHQVFFEA
ncbi:asparagine synthase (glutamine-hydrolyzing) [Lachnospiraceae bacterium WCA-9-b2]|uniref:asparagine synthase (glutamine-hydrolyzing) n=2 Tax=Sporofaciens musculi TaxID=2681861 RepID=A0A7X3MFL1_9FIRM|nr:asparagine synthase (glutamine-hydrolyzing) [Sporofaciens musculi]MXP75442.1 asparagine synthase (glutamine-hydrolyzing) [Sporofaciens musculi]